MTTDASSSIAWYLAIAVLVLAVLLTAWVARKGRHLPVEHVFRASHWTRGNHLFPTQVVLTPSSLTLFKPQWIGKLEESIHMTHVASIKINTNLMFANVYIESSGGQDPIVCHGHSKSDAVKM